MGAFATVDTVVFLLQKLRRIQKMNQFGLFKTKKSMITAIIAAVALIAVIVLAIVLPKEVSSGSVYYGTFMSLVPPIIAIGLALITKEVFSSLFAGVFVAALFASN